MINFSELLLKSGQRGDPGRRNVPVAEPDGIPVVPALQHMPVERVQLESGSVVDQLTDSRSAGADRFRFLRLRMRELRELAKLRSVVITSPIPEDGKSTITLSLATVLAEGGKNSVLLIDADLHHSSIASNLAIPEHAGFAECLEGGLKPMSQIIRVEPLGWYLLQAGKPRGNPTELLQSATLSTVMEEISMYFDWILIDAPPVLPLTDALSLSRQVDATLLVARAGRTSKEAIEESIKLIGQKNVLGIILNGAEGLTRLYSRYNGRYAKV